MDNNIKATTKLQANRLIEKLRTNNFGADYFETKEEVIDYLKENINEGSSIALGGSMTLFEAGIIDYLNDNKDKYEFIDRYHTDNIEEAYLKAFSADIFFTSTNAITLDGMLYNVDGRGSRVAPLIFGPKKVYVVTGVNKIVKDLDEAKKRVEHLAAPANNIRLNKDNPCTMLGECAHCNKPDTICNQYVVTRRSGVKDRIHILLINDEFGY